MHAPTAAAPATTKERSAPRHQRSLAQVLWDIDWSRHLPLTLTNDGIDVEYSSFEQTAGFVSQHYAAIFEQTEGSVFTGGKVGARERYYREVGDFFAFKLEERTIGVLVCTPVDWSTYYFRSGALLPEYQDRKLMQSFVPLLFALLAAAGVERIEADTAPSNLRMMQLLTRLEFNVTGTVLSERWGAQVHFTKFLMEAEQDVFLKQFCSGVKYQMKRSLTPRERDNRYAMR